MKIANIDIPSSAVLAPIAGFTDVGMRHIAKGYGAGLTYTEMISCKGMVYGSEKTRELLATSPLEETKAVQIFGNDSLIMAKAVALPEIQKFDIIDINMGCPVPKIVRNGEGSAMMLDIKNSSEVVKAVISSSGKPVTIKTRLGFETTDFRAVEFALRMQDAGVSAITIHGRTREQYYHGNADWDKIAEVVSKLSIPVIANGDVLDYESYTAILQHTNAAGVMIARGAIGNPQIFLDISRHHSLSTELKTVDIHRDILAQIEMLTQYYEDRYIYCNMKKHICYYLRGISGSKPLKDRVCRVDSLSQLIECVNLIPYRCKE